MVEVDKKAELLEVYDLHEDFIKVDERAKIYKELEEEYQSTKKITKQLRTVRALIMNTRGRILLQKRSEDKSYNAGLYDKTLGGHCNHRQQSDLALVAELAEELESPGFVCESADFLYNVRNINLQVVGLFKSLGYQSGWMSHRAGNSNRGVKDIEQPLMNHFYFGVYDGRFSWIDSEVRGMDSFTLEELMNSMQKTPEIFTKDMHYMLPMYEPHIKAVLERLEL
ncbi:NUDIX domain-containing protein [Candidatus Woesearchaeota archaeon]|nr:NUDIX domain-containing protein [Candidatus Woesearchaeota archaeon]